MQWKEFYRLKFSIYRLKFRKIYIYKDQCKYLFKF